MAAPRSVCKLSHHSKRKKIAPSANIAGTTRAGPYLPSAREMPMTAMYDTIAAPIIAAGRRPSPKCERNSVSRVALPATCCATSEPDAMAAGQTVAITDDGALGACEDPFIARAGGYQQSRDAGRGAAMLGRE